jgi:hypothetical protein
VIVAVAVAKSVVLSVIVNVVKAMILFHPRLLMEVILVDCSPA